MILSAYHYTMKSSKFIFSPLLILILSQIACSQSPLSYRIDLRNIDDDIFKVELIKPHLSKEDTIYQFASTAPGTYQIMDIGRFVKAFKAFDKKGNEIKTEKISVNQFRLHNPKKIALIKYDISEVWDSQIDEHIPWPMASTSIENDHVLLNNHCVIGFPISQQGSPVELRLEYLETWKLGTPLNKVKENTYFADNYDHLIDSPILLGNLSYASTELNNTKIEIYTYSKTGLIKSEDLLDNILDILKAADKFLVEFPVERYTFLFHFEDKNAGAWEHSYSSEYVLPEYELTPYYVQGIKSIASHEFFHIITPLNIHSEIIEQFNFTEPVPSKHLWLYEGVTEWASDIMQLRGGLITLDQFLKQMQLKLNSNDRYDSTYSLEKLALTSFEIEGNKQYSNIYAKGAIVATLLDIKLLELSNGKKGLREVINELTKRYGKENAFPEDEFYQIFVDITYPEIEDFISNYIRNTSPLPLQEYFSKLGINYFDVFKEDNSSSKIKHHFIINNDANETQLKLRNAWLTNLN